jgi:hypothetical protein
MSLLVLFCFKRKGSLIYFITNIDLMCHQNHTVSTICRASDYSALIKLKHTREKGRVVESLLEQISSSNELISKRDAIRLQFSLIF